jgi:hypothetical protein
MALLDKSVNGTLEDILLYFFGGFLGESGYQLLGFAGPLAPI